MSQTLDDVSSLVYYQKSPFKTSDLNLSYCSLAHYFSQSPRWSNFNVNYILPLQYLLTDLAGSLSHRFLSQLKKKTKQIQGLCPI